MIMSVRTISNKKQTVSTHPTTYTKWLVIMVRTGIIHKRPWKCFLTILLILKRMIWSYILSQSVHDVMYVFFWESLIWWPKGMLTSLYARPLWPLENVWGHNLQQRDCGQHSSLNSSLHSSLSLYWYYMYYVPPLVVVAWSTVEMAQWVILSRIE